MGIVDRVGRAIALGETALRHNSVEDEAGRILALESPLFADRMKSSVVDHVIGLGPIQRLLEDPEVTDVLVNGPTSVWVDRGHHVEETDVVFESEEHLVATIERVIAPLGLRIDRSAPMVDARLPDGSRLHAVLPPASVDHPLVAIRRFTPKLSGMDDLITSGTATQDQVAHLAEASLGTHINPPTHVA